MVEENESLLRSHMENIYFGKTKEVKELVLIKVIDLFECKT